MSSPHTRTFLTALQQHTRLGALALEAGYHAPAISHALPNMMRMMLRILLPHVAEEEIAAFESSAGNALLIDWWAVTDATLPSA
jgi:hypothetical protein